MKYTATLGFVKQTGITIKSVKELASMRAAGRIVALVKEMLKEAIRPGIATVELDRMAEREIKRQGAKLSFKGYLGYPATICVSLNEQVVHGIPSRRVIQKGDVVSVDVGAVVDGFHADSAFTMGAGGITDEAERLIDSTRESLRLGILQARAGARVGDISAAVQNYAEEKGYGVVREYVGHGIGRQLHEDPKVPNYGAPGVGPLLREGMTLAIEPMLNIGSCETMQLEDGWTVVTADGSCSAHFEDTVVITDNGPEVFTASR